MLLAAPTTAPAWIADKLQFFDDPLFRFEEERHLYWYGEKQLTSITTWGKDYKEPFNREERAEITAYNRQCTVEEILAEWDYSSTLGTIVHKYIEYFLAGAYSEMVNVPQDEEQHRRCTKFGSFARARLKDFIPIGLELRIYLLSLGLAGTLDGLMWHVPTRSLWVFDWKTSKAVLTDKTRRNSRYLNAPFFGFFDHEHNNYSLQLSWYRRMLAAAGIPTAGGVIVHIPPGDAPAYMLKARDFTPMLEAHFPA